MKKSMIYTRTGDDGTTSLIGGVRVPKTHLRLEAYGTVDELNAQIGYLISLMDDGEDKSLLRFVQHKLFALGGYLATDTSQTGLQAACQISDENVARLEEAIDAADTSLPPMQAFILPGGAVAASVCHVCRTVCRRAERCILALEASDEHYEIARNVKQFVNRLSDYLFVLSRKLNQLTHCDEIYWDKSCK